MITGLQIALLGGLTFGAGLAVLLWRLAPAHPDLDDVLARLSPQGGRRHRDQHPAEGPPELADQVGLWAMRRLSGGIWGKTPTRELALLGVPLQRHYGKKIVFALAGLVLGPLLAGIFAIFGFTPPVLIPLAGSVGLAALMFFVPDLDVRADAKKARAEFTRALGAYVDLVALERNAGSAPRQAMESAAAIGDNWVFRRLSEELSRSRWSGHAPWDALHALSGELGLPELSDIADIMRLSGEEGTQVYTTLRARSSAMRATMLNNELARANAINERMTIPMSLLGAIFLVMLLVPSLLRVLNG